MSIVDLRTTIYLQEYTMNVLVVYLSASAASSAYAGTAAPLPMVVESGDQCLQSAEPVIQRSFPCLLTQPTPAFTSKNCQRRTHHYRCRHRSQPLSAEPCVAPSIRRNAYKALVLSAVFMAASRSTAPWFCRRTIFSPRRSGRHYCTCPQW